MTYRDTTWSAEEMGSEGWAVFAGPKMIASNLAEHHALKIVTACNCHEELVEALEDIAEGEGAYSHDQFTHAINTITNMRRIAREVLAKAKEEQR